MQIAHRALELSTVVSPAPKDPGYCKRGSSGCRLRTPTFLLRPAQTRICNEHKVDQCRERHTCTTRLRSSSQIRTLLRALVLAASRLLLLARGFATVPGDPNHGPGVLQKGDLAAASTCSRALLRRGVLQLTEESMLKTEYKAWKQMRDTCQKRATQMSEQ